MFYAFITYISNFIKKEKDDNIHTIEAKLKGSIRIEPT